MPANTVGVGRHTRVSAGGRCLVGLLDLVGVPADLLGVAADPGGKVAAAGDTGFGIDGPREVFDALVQTLLALLGLLALTLTLSLQLGERGPLAFGHDLLLSRLSPVGLRTRGAAPR